jgi:hypothetical protein
MAVPDRYSQRLLELVKLPSAGTDLITEARRLDVQAVPLVHELQGYQRPDGSIEPLQHKAAAQAMSALRDALRDSALFPRASLAALDHDLERWRAAGLESPPRFDASRDAIEGPGDKELGLFAGPAFMPNSDTQAPLFQLALVMHDEPDSLRSVTKDYPHPDSACQMIRVLTGSRQARDGQCVVLFPENIPASTSVTRQKFAWFLMNKHIPTYQWTLARIRERCGDSLFAEGEPLASPKLDAEGIYDTRCCWAHLHEHHHQLGPRPLARNLGLKTQPYPGLLEELKVDCQSLQACLSDTAMPYRLEVFEFVLFDRLFRYPTAADALSNGDSGAGVLLGTWLLRHGAVQAADGRSQLVSRAETVRAVDALVAEILALEDLDETTYTKEVERFTLSVLDPPARSDEKYAKPADWLSSVFADVTGSNARAGAGDD